MECWVHCNTCFVQPGDIKTSFKLTSCGHIFCANCLEKAESDGSKLCKTCGQVYQGVVPLSSQMKPDVQLYFTDLNNLSKKFVQQHQQVAEFQKGHLMRLATFRKQQLSKASRVIREKDRQLEVLKSALANTGCNVSEVLHKATANHPLTPYAAIPSTPNTFTPAAPGSRHLTPYPRTPGGLISQSQSASSNHTSMKRGSMMGSMTNLASQSNRKMTSPASMNHQSGRSAPSPIAHGSSSQKSMLGPGRISVRTPPVNGKLGPIGTSGRYDGSGRLSSSNSPRRTPGRETPGSGGNLMRASPLCRSSSPANRALQTPQNRQAPYSRPTSKISQNLSASFPRSSPSPKPVVAGARPIQVGYPGRGSLLSRNGSRPIPKP